MKTPHLIKVIARSAMPAAARPKAGLLSFCAGMLSLAGLIIAMPAWAVTSLPQDALSLQLATVNENRSSSMQFKIQNLEFRKARLIDVMRTISELSGLNIVASQAAGAKEVTIYLRDITVHDAIDAISRSSGLWYKQDRQSGAYRIMTTEEYQKDVVVFREDMTKVFNLLHPNPVIVATAIRDIFGSRVLLSLGVEDNTGLGGIGGIGGRAGGGGFSGGIGLGGFGGGAGIGLGGRSSAGARSFTSRQTGGRLGGSFGGGIGGFAAGAGNRISDQVINETLTADQLAKLDAALEEDPGDNQVSSEALKKISRTEQLIYITVNREHNLIIVRTSDRDALQEIESLVREMDRPTPQVLLEMKVLELLSSDTFRQSFSLTATSGDGKHVLGLGNFPAEGGTLVYQFMDDVIAARLELLQANNRVNTLSSPILLASNNKPSQVFVGEERVLVTGVTVTQGIATNAGIIPATISPETEVRNIGNTLVILPKINADKTVTLVIQQDSSSVNVNGGSIPVVVGNEVQSFVIDTVNTSNIQGTVVAKDGLTVAIGGLISTRYIDNVQKVPLIGDIPVLGQLFQRKEQVEAKSELILLITPHIITTPNETENVSRRDIQPLSDQRW